MSRKRHMIEQNKRNGGRQGLNKRDLFIRQRIPKLFAPAELCAQRRTASRRGSERKRYGKKKGEAIGESDCQQSARDVLSGLVLFHRSVVGPAPRPAIYSSYFITRPRNGNTSQTSVRLTSPSLRFSALDFDTVAKPSILRALLAYSCEK